ncbi:MAG: phosphodiester glycosidase family protein [Abditibacteriales bacterium]|nr:phosphodiester glycosidase family protein [Abditibacteriales bacterium]MDW8366158.1 phosphodiester glycosidase family protein [Abditibacteriales bacterium]
MLCLFDFDLAANPHLRLELYDQDEDDEVPFDNAVDYWRRGVGQVTSHLNTTGRGQAVAAWNGLFFATDDKAGGYKGTGRHIAPVVLQGRVYDNVGNHRWTFGVQYQNGRPVFKSLHLPDRSTLAREFTFAAAGAQCLVRHGLPVKLQPFPRPGDKPIPQPVPSTPEEVGHIPVVDHIRTSRTSMGWSRDNRHLYLLIVKEPDSETASVWAFRHRVPLRGGWTVADLQRFWQAMKVWGAVNIDGGEVTQMVYRRKDGQYAMIPPRWAALQPLLLFPPSLPNAPEGGTLMYFYVRDTRG